MVIVYLMGGLGNQMFQYAAGRRLAYVLKADLRLDTNEFDVDKLRTYALGAFNIQEHFATAEEVAAFTISKRGILNRLVERMLRIPCNPPSTHIKEKHFHFDSSVLSLNDDVYLDGYWQSEKYFVDASNIIFKEFTVKSPQTGKNKELAELITSCNAVSIHVRRGDYISDPHISKLYRTCDLAYYIRCFDKITQSIQNPHFFIFGDEPKWIRKNINLPYSTTIVDHNGDDKSYEDLRLMSICKHNIIANSSFSWWGAWLNQNPKKMVFAPKQWFSKERQASRKMDDLLPASWSLL